MADEPAEEVVVGERVCWVGDGEGVEPGEGEDACLELGRRGKWWKVDRE